MDYIYSVCVKLLNGWNQEPAKPFKKPDGYKNINTTSLVKNRYN